MQKSWTVTAALFLSTVAMGQVFKLGSKIDDFSVQDLNGNSATFSQLKGDITVVAFISTQCPVSNAYNDRMNALYREYSSKGVNFLFLNANNSESAEVVAEHSNRMLKNSLGQNSAFSLFLFPEA